MFAAAQPKGEVSMRRAYPRRVLWVSGVVWTASWFCLGLEIFYWHHVTKTLRVNPPEAPLGYPKPQPGHFLISVLAGSALGPAVFLAAVLAARTGNLRRKPQGLDFGAA
jgi:hypothetical protein